MTTWHVRAREVTTPTVFAALGIRPMPRGTYGPCPACSAERRGKQDNRGPIGVRPDGLGWHCHACGRSGDGIGAVRLRESDPWAWYADRGWADPLPGRTSTPIAPPAPKPLPPPKPAVPVEDVALLLSRCVSADPTWADARMSSAALVPGLVGCLPERAPLPPWARSAGGSWHESGHVALVPLWGLSGRLAGIRARAPGPRADGTPKALPPTGYAVPKALMANPTARRWLRGAELPESIVLVEGEPAWVLWSVACPTSAVLGFYSGAWDAAWLAKIDDADRPVLLVTDHDRAGDEYARKLGVLRRSARWPEEKDAVVDFTG